MKRLICLCSVLALSACGATSSKDAADEICSALCERARECDPRIAVESCTSQCVGEACADGCSGEVSDEARLEACLDAVRDLSCSATGLPASCYGVIR